VEAARRDGDFLGNLSDAQSLNAKGLDFCVQFWGHHIGPLVGFRLFFDCCSHFGFLLLFLLLRDWLIKPFVTIDNAENLDKITAVLGQFAELEEHDRNQSIICIVGNFMADKAGIALKVMNAMRDIPIRMIAYGASEHNISLLVDTKHKNEALNALNEGLFKFD
jgi:hypothetical protein